MAVWFIIKYIVSQETQLSLCTLHLQVEANENLFAKNPFTITNVVIYQLNPLL